MFTANLKLAALCIAIARKEGWKEVGEGIPAGGSRSFRNHNPGNLRRSPFQDHTEAGFAIFKNDIIGWIALAWDLTEKAKGNSVTKLNGSSTLRQLIYAWAPPNDSNDTEKYLEDICKWTGLDESETLQSIILED